VELSEHEQRILQQIERQFEENDPALAGQLESTSLYTHTISRMKWSVLAFLVGVAILVVALATATTIVVAFGGFLLMLLAALWFERNARKLGRVGWEQATTSLRTGGLRDQLGQRRDRMRERFHRDDS
jgi:hypothetical protein